MGKSFCVHQPALSVALCLCAVVPLCMQNELQLIKNKPCNICIRFQSIGEKNVISPQQNIKEKERKLKTCDQFLRKSQVFYKDTFWLFQLWAPWVVWPSLWFSNGWKTSVSIFLWLLNWRAQLVSFLCAFVWNVRNYTKNWALKQFAEVWISEGIRWVLCQLERGRNLWERRVIRYWEETKQDSGEDFPANNV